MDEQQPGCVGGLHEVCVGVPDLIEAAAYYQAFGYRIGATGEMDCAAARALYGVDSALRSARLLHGCADHGLIRLMQWERPVNTGLGLSRNLRGYGSRWGVHGTRSIANILNHAERARDAGAPIEIVPPVLVVISEASGERDGVAFRDPVVGVREMIILQPLYRQVVFERFAYDSPLYGSIEPNSLLQASQHTHAGMMIATDDHHVLDFYEDVLGLQRWMDLHVPYERAGARRQSFGLDENEDLQITDFDDPRSGKALAQRRSGKLKCIRIAGRARIEDCRLRSRAGSLGYSLYSWRARDIEAIHRRVGSNGGQKVTDVVPDEFGRHAFTFDAPDGYQWVLVGA